MDPYRVFLRTADRHGMFPPGCRVIAAVSGGPDSSALLCLVRRLAAQRPIEIHVAHLDHGMRGERGREEQEHVRRLASRWRLPFHPGSADVRTLATRERRSPEEAARILRYRFLRGIAEFAGADRIATGHTLDDQVEGFLLRLVRGSGARGLGSLHPVLRGKPPVVRPLVGLRRTDILQVLGREGIRPFEDETNADTAYARNRVRAEVLPVLEKVFGGRAWRAIARASELLREEDDLLEALAAEIADRALGREVGAVLLQAGTLAGTHRALARRVVRRAIQEARGSLRRIGLQHVDRILALGETASNEGEVALPGGSRAVRAGDTIRITGGPFPGLPSYEYRLDIPGRTPIPEAGLVIEATVMEGAPPAQRMRSEAPMGVFLDARAVQGPVLVRSRRPGDRFVPLGFTLGSRRLARVLVDRKVPRSSRPLLPLVVSGDTVLWVPGLPPSDRAKVDSGTTRVVFLTARPL